MFGGDNSGVAPIADYFSSTTSAAKNDIDTAFQTTFGFAPTSASASTISGTDMQNFITNSVDPLFSGANWTTDWSSASSTNVTTQISPGDSVDDFDRRQPTRFPAARRRLYVAHRIRRLVADTSAQQTVITAASSLINQGIASLTTTEATLGASQASVTAATTSMSNQLTILQSQIGNLDNVNANSVAVQLNSLQTQLETAYQLTAQLQKMSLAQYLPT